MPIGEANKNFPPKTPNTYRVTLPAGINFDFVSAYTMFPYTIDIINNNNSQVFEYYTQEVYQDSELIFSNKYTRFRNSVTNYTLGEDKGASILLISGSTYKVVYTMERDFSTPLPAYDKENSFTNRVSYTFTVVENKLPLKPWTITGVINRLLDVCEPLRKGEKPRFRLNGMSEDGKIIPEGEEGSGQAAQFDKILAPQFALTRQTLRECLQEIGRFIHGEPRLKIQKDSTGKYYYEVLYDLYAAGEKAGVYYRPYARKTMEFVINNYQTWVDTNAENLINQLDKLGGVIVEPYDGGAKSVRTENQYVRITDENMLIATQYPIYTVDKLEYVYDNGNVIFNMFCIDLGLYVEKYSSLEGDLKTANDFINLYGFTFSAIANVKDYVHIHKYHNYIKAQLQSINGNLNNMARADLRQRFANGIRFWNNDTVDYSYENYELWLED